MDHLVAASTQQALDLGAVSPGDGGRRRRRRDQRRRTASSVPSVDHGLRRNSASIAVDAGRQMPS